MFGDLEAPGALLDAARLLATNNNELLMMTTGPDVTSKQMLNNSLLQLERLGLRRSVLVLADSVTTCDSLAPPCYWSSRVLINAPSDSIVNQRCFARAVLSGGYATGSRGPLHFLPGDADAKPMLVCFSTTGFGAGGSSSTM